MSKVEITRIEAMNSIQLLNLLHKEVIEIKVKIGELTERVDNLKDHSKDLKKNFGDETSAVHENCIKRYEKCNEKFENLAVKQSTDFGKLESQVKLLIGKYGTICIIVSSVLTGLIVKYIS